MRGGRGRARGTGCAGGPTSHDGPERCLGRLSSGECPLEEGPDSRCWRRGVAWGGRSRAVVGGVGWGDGWALHVMIAVSRQYGPLNGPDRRKTAITGSRGRRGHDSGGRPGRFPSGECPLEEGADAGCPRCRVGCGRGIPIGALPGVSCRRPDLACRRPDLARMGHGAAWGGPSPVLHPHGARPGAATSLGRRVGCRARQLWHKRPGAGEAAHGRPLHRLRRTRGRYPDGRGPGLGHRDR